ncbi:MAG: protein BatD [Bacteroidetes bacterium]|nr:protein BatD [Bacteroidota bacterium]
MKVLLLTHHSQLATHDSQLTTLDSQLATHDSQLTTRNSQLSTHNSQLTTLILLSCCFFVFSFNTAFAQSKALFEVSTDAKQVVVGGYFEVSFSLKNANGSGFQAPSFKDFVVVGGPSQSVSTSIINGKVSKELTYSYTLQPRKKGTFTIRSASIKAEGKTLTTRPVKIEVVEGKSGKESGNQGGRVFIKAELSTSEAFIGQQIILDYKLYTTRDIDQYNILEESDYQGFYAQDVKRFDSRTLREVLDGVQYSTRVLKRMALFPQQAGVLSIDPLYMQLGVVVGDPRNRNSFFFNRKIQWLPQQTEAVGITIKALPTDTLSSFTGAVGQFSMIAAIDKKTLTTDDALSLVLTISGNGDIKRVQAPPMIFPESFEIYDPRIVQESSIEARGEITGKKVIEYLAVPRTPGQYTIEPAFTYFDTDSAKYVTLTENNLSISVRQGSQSNISPVIADDASIPKEDIRFIKLHTSFNSGKQSFLGSVFFWILAIFPFIFLAGVFVYKQASIRNSNVDIGLLKSKRAKKIALKKLIVAEKMLKENNSRLFYDEVSKAMLGYVCDKLQIPLSELTKDNVRDELRSLEISSESIEKYMNVVQTCEMALFAGMDNKDAMEETYSSATTALTNIEMEIGK